MLRVGQEEVPLDLSMWAMPQVKHIEQEKEPNQEISAI